MCRKINYDARNFINVCKKYEEMHMQEIKWKMALATTLLVISSLLAGCGDSSSSTSGNTNNPSVENDNEGNENANVDIMPFVLNDIENSIFLVQIEMPDEPEYGVMVFQKLSDVEENEFPQTGSIDLLANFTGNGGNGYGEEFYWSICEEGNIQIYLMDHPSEIPDTFLPENTNPDWTIMRRSTVNVGGTVRHVVDVAIHASGTDSSDTQSATMQSATMQRHIPFVADEIADSTYEITVLENDCETPPEENTVTLRLFQNVNMGGYGEFIERQECDSTQNTTVSLEWNVHPQLGVLVMELAPLPAEVDEYTDLLYFLRFSGNNAAFTGVYIDAEEYEDAPRRFTDGGRITVERTSPSQ
jgi:hypothetical protein